jgi:hypothetical protein
MTSGYSLYIPAAIERRIGQLAVEVQRAIRAALHQIVMGAPATRSGTAAQPLVPAMRFYAGGYRVFYEVERHARRVVVLELRRASA